MMIQCYSVKLFLQDIKMCHSMFFCMLWNTNERVDWIVLWKKKIRISWLSGLSCILIVFDSLQPLLALVDFDLDSY